MVFNKTTIYFLTYFPILKAINTFYKLLTVLFYQSSGKYQLWPISFTCITLWQSWFMFTLQLPLIYYNFPSTNTEEFWNFSIDIPRKLKIIIADLYYIQEFLVSLLYLTLSAWRWRHAPDFVMALSALYFTQILLFSL